MKDIQFKNLLLKSRELFMKYGVKKLTMDEIARELSMSKKTIYQFVENKSDLVRLTLHDYLEEERAQMDSIRKSSANSADEMIKLIAYFMQIVHEMNAMALFDLQKYYPETWAMYTDYRVNFMLVRIGDNLKRGVKEGYYREDMDVDIIARVYVMGIEILVNQEVFPVKKYTLSTIYREFLNYHMRGIVSAKGLKFLDEHNLTGIGTTS
jgi:AcrR family transcriptional regulator